MEPKLKKDSREVIASILKALGSVKPGYRFSYRLFERDAKIITEDILANIDSGSLSNIQSDMLDFVLKSASLTYPDQINDITERLKKHPSYKSLMVWIKREVCEIFFCLFSESSDKITFGLDAISDKLSSLYGVPFEVSEIATSYCITLSLFSIQLPVVNTIPEEQIHLHACVFKAFTDVVGDVVATHLVSVFEQRQVFVDVLQGNSSQEKNKVRVLMRDVGSRYWRNGKIMPITTLSKLLGSYLTKAELESLRKKNKDSLATQMREIKTELAEIDEYWPQGTKEPVLLYFQNAWKDGVLVERLSAKISRHPADADSSLAKDLTEIKKAALHVFKDQIKKDPRYPRIPQEVRPSRGVPNNPETQVTSVTDKIYELIIKYQENNLTGHKNSQFLIKSFSNAHIRQNLAEELISACYDGTNLAIEDIRFAIQAKEEQLMEQAKTEQQHLLTLLNEFTLHKGIVCTMSGVSEQNTKLSSPKKAIVLEVAKEMYDAISASYLVGRPLIAYERQFLIDRMEVIAKKHEAALGKFEGNKVKRFLGKVKQFFYERLRLTPKHTGEAAKTLLLLERSRTRLAQEMGKPLACQPTTTQSAGPR